MLHELWQWLHQEVLLRQVVSSTQEVYSVLPPSLLAADLGRQTFCGAEVVDITAELSCRFCRPHHTRGAYPSILATDTQNILLKSCTNNVNKLATETWGASNFEESECSSKQPDQTRGTKRYGNKHVTDSGRCTPVLANSAGETVIWSACMMVTRRYRTLGLTVIHLQDLEVYQCNLNPLCIHTYICFFHGTTTRSVLVV
jgi:hypothetical protein